MNDPAKAQLDQEFDSAFAQLATLVDFRRIEEQFPVRENAGYTSSVVSWMRSISGSVRRNCSQRL